MSILWVYFVEILTHSAASSRSAEPLDWTPGLESVERLMAEAPPFKAERGSAAQGQPLPTGRQAEQVPVFRPESRRVDFFRNIL